MAYYIICMLFVGTVFWVKANGKRKLSTTVFEVIDNNGLNFLAFQLLHPEARELQSETFLQVMKRLCTELGSKDLLN